MNHEFTLSLFYEFGNYCKQHIVNSSHLHVQDLELFIISPTLMLEIHEQEIQSKVQLRVLTSSFCMASYI